MQRIYLDYAAASPVDKRVLDEMLPYFNDNFYNPSALYEGARNTKQELEQARSRTAQLIGAKPSEIIFTAGGTESANLAIRGAMKGQRIASHIVISAIEHDAVMKPAMEYANTIVKVDRKGFVDVRALKKSCTDKTALVSVMLANNEIGTVQPIKLISEVIKQIRIERKDKGLKHPIYLHVDACQAPLYLDINVARLGVDMMTLNGGKIYGPKQSGILYVKAGVVLKPVIAGGGQEWGYRSGTENVAFAVGFAKALELADKGRQKRAKDMIVLRDYFIRELELRFSAEITGHRTRRLANNVHVVIPGIDNERVLFALDDAGIDAAAGSACSASKDVSSHVVLALGMTDEDARASLRFSLGKSTTKEFLDKTIKILSTAIQA